MNKRLLILGASGRTGILALKMALEKNYKVTILVRNPEKLNINNPKLKIIKGSPTNIEDLRKVMKECNVVMSFLAALPQKDMITLHPIKPLHVLKTSIKNTIKIMKEQNVKRILIMSSIGAGNSFMFLPWLLKIFFKLTNMKIVLDDHNAQEKLVYNSELDWTVVRSVGLKDNLKKGKIIIDFESRPILMKIKRNSVVQFFFDILYSDKFTKKTVIISQ